MPEPNARLKSRREGIALSQAELAEQVGVSEMTVRRWETGLRPQPAHLRRLCAVLDASPAELGYGPKDSPTPTEMTPDPHPEGRPGFLILDARTLLEVLGTARWTQLLTELAVSVDVTPEPGLPLDLISESGRLLATNLGLQPPPEDSSPDKVVGPTSYTGCRLSQFRIRGSRGDVLMGVADESARFLRDTESSQIGSLTLEQLEADLHRLAHAYLNQPLDELFFPTVGLRNVVFSLLERNRNKRSTPRTPTRPWPTGTRPRSKPSRPSPATRLSPSTTCF